MRIDKLKILRLAFISTFLLLCFFFLTSKKEMSNIDCEIDSAGVVLTFDDLLVDNWYQAHQEIFSNRGVKATFYLTNIDRLSEEPMLVEKLLEMQSFGHEMGNHTMNHLNSEESLLGMTLDEYFEQEVKSTNEIGESLGFSFSSFSHPYGVGTEELDERLLEKFKTVRYTGSFSPENNRIFYTDGCFRILAAGSLDSRRGVSKQDISKAVERAYEENSVLMIYAHKIEDISSEGNLGSYSISYEKLNHLIDEVYKRDMEFFTVSEVFSGESF